MRSRLIVLLSALLLVAGCSDSSPSTVQPASLLERMVTSVKPGIGQAWLCGVGERVVAAYLFLPPGQIEELNPAHRLGMEIDHSKASMADQTRYLWDVDGNGSMIMDTLDGRDPITWSHIQFIAADQIQVESSTKGPMDCYRGTGEWQGAA